MPGHICLILSLALNDGFLCVYRSYAPKHVESMKSMFEGSKVSGKGKVKEEIDTSSADNPAMESMKSMFEGSKVSGKGKAKEEIDTSSADNPAQAPEKQLSFV